jgi:hypothetical protein
VPINKEDELIALGEKEKLSYRKGRLNPEKKKEVQIIKQQQRVEHGFDLKKKKAGRRCLGGC